MSDDVQDPVGLMDAIFHRRAVRAYLDRPVERALIDKLLQAAVQAPSALNQQPWGFAVVHGRRRLREYSERAKRYLVGAYPATFELRPRTDLYQDPAYDVFHGATTLIVVYAGPGRLHPNEDCCLAAENLMLAAYSFGLGTCPIGFARPWLDLAETKREFGILKHYSAVFPMVVGYPAGDTAAPPREDPEILCWQWDED